VVVVLWFRDGAKRTIAVRMRKKIKDFMAAV